MGFDAGSITAKMVLDSSEFDATAQEVQDKKEELASDITFDVKPELDEEAVEKVEEEKEQNATEVVYEVKPELNEDAVAEIAAEKELDAAPVEYEVAPTFNAAQVSNVAKDLGDSFARDLGRSLSGEGSDAAAIDRQLSNLLNSGLSGLDLTDSLSALGNPGADIAAALERAGYGAEGAPLIAAAMLPTEEDLSRAIESGIAEITTGNYSLPGGGEGKLNIGTGILTGLLDNIAKDTNGDQLALNAGLGDGVHFADEYMDGLYRSFAREAPMVFDNNGEQLQIGSGIVDAVGRDVSSSISKAEKDGSGGGIFSSIVSSLVDGGGAALPEIGTGAFVATLAPIFLPAIAALGMTLGGMLAGTIIGGLGTATFGLEASKAIESIATAISTQQQINNGTITQAQGNTILDGLTPGAAAAATQILPFLTELKKIIDSQDGPIFTIISNFLESLAKDTPLIGPYLDTVTKAMGGFFTQADSVLGSQNFSATVTDITHLTGPVMTDFGDFIIKFGGAVSSWLVMMGPIVTTIGPGFASLAGDLEHLADNTHITPAFLKTITDLGRDFSDAWGLIETALSVGSKAAGPLASAIFSQIPTLSGFLRELLKDMPPQLTTDILAVVLALTAFSKIPTLTVILLGLDALDHVMQALGIHMTPKIAAGIEAVAGALLILSKLGAMDGIATALGGIAGSMGIISGEETAAGVITAVGGAAATAMLVLAPYVAALTTLVGIYEILKPQKLSSGEIASPLTGATNGAVMTPAQMAYENAQLAPYDKHVTSSGQIVSGPAPANGYSGMPGYSSGPTIGAPHAMGGPVTAGVSYPVGENGVELFTPNTNGFITPNSSGGAQGHTIVFQIDARGATNPTAIRQAVSTGVTNALPSLSAALGRGSGS